MFCPKCGNQLPDNATFCNQCGNPLAPNRAAAPAKPFSLNLKASLTGLILKLIALTNFLFTFIFAIVMAAKVGQLLKLVSLAGSVSSYGSYSSMGNVGGGGFGLFLIIFFSGLINTAIVYGIGDIIERMGDKKSE